MEQENKEVTRDGKPLTGLAQVQDGNIIDVKESDKQIHLSRLMQLEEAFPDAIDGLKIAAGMCLNEPKYKRILDNILKPLIKKLEAI